MFCPSKGYLFENLKSFRYRMSKYMCPMVEIKVKFCNEGFVGAVVVKLRIFEYDNYCSHAHHL